MADKTILGVLMRGGTSKGVFLPRSLLPPAGLLRDQFVLDILGSPDPMQLDGLGGTHSSTSKLVAVGPGRRPEVDVDYLFVQVGVEAATLDYKGNCGNLTSAVGAYAIDEGLVEAVEPVTVVRMYNENTGKLVSGHIPVEGDRAATRGDFSIAGVPGTGARIRTEFHDPAGAVFGTLFPTGRALDRLRVPDVGPVEVSIVDVTTPVVFVHAGAIGLEGTELPNELNRDPDVVARLEKIRSAAAVELGVVERAGDAARLSPAVPSLAIVSPPGPAPLVDGGTLQPGEVDIVSRITSSGRVHHAHTLTGLMCTAAAGLLEGTIPHDVVANTHTGRLRIGHPKGMTAVEVDVDPAEPRVRSVVVERTARRLMAGEIYLRSSLD
ncbi:MAG: 3-methylitaconate isomerase [Acidimicrobiia bacterium]|nr:3-methylitaconate isomerase [Acidimicrobiia bacterium]